MKSLFAKFTTLMLCCTGLFALQGCGSGCGGEYSYKNYPTYVIATDSATKILNIRYIGSNVELTPYMADSSSYCSFHVSTSQDTTLLVIETPGKTDTVCFTTTLSSIVVVSYECSSDELQVIRSNPEIAYHTCAFIKRSDYYSNNSYSYYNSSISYVYRIGP